MADKLRKSKGERTMSQGFIAQYAAEAALRVGGVASLEKSFVANLKESFGVIHEGQGVEVIFDEDKHDAVAITVYPLIYYSYDIPEVAWHIQKNVRNDVEEYTGLDVNQVNVYVKDIIPLEKKEDKEDA